MRLAIIGVVTVAAAFAADVQAASALNYDSFFQERYCSRRANGRYNCAFKTLAQCKFAIEEIPDRFCIENPWGWASTADRARQEPSAQSLVNDPRPSPHRLSRRRVSEAVPKFKMMNRKTATALGLAIPHRFCCARMR